MNICMISAYPPQTGGIPVHTEALMRHLSRKHKVHLITYGKLGRKARENVTITEVPVINVKFLRGLSFFIGCCMAIRKTCKENRIDVIHAHYMHPPGTAAALYRKRTKGKERLVVTAHGSDLLSLGSGRIGKALVRFCAGKADKLICVSTHLSSVAQDLGIPKGMIEVVYNGIDESKIPRASKENLRKKLRLHSEKVVTFAGALNEAKGADIFIVLAEHLSRRDKDASFVLVGKGPLKDDLEKKVARAGLEERVIFAGEKSNEETLEYIKASDVVVVPSRIEGFGLTALEAAMAGVPVVTSRNGALPEIVSGVSATDNMPATVLKIITVNKFSRHVVEENRKAVRRFSVERMCSETEKAYRKS